MSVSSQGTPVRANGTDIIDLDRYMRAAVRPSRPQNARERLIVDAGGVNRPPVDLDSSSDSSPLHSRPYARDHYKQYSHDSGLSDGSYLRQRYRPQRRVSVHKSRESSRAAGSNSSIREFKAACEKALHEQQQQITRVAELCEKLIQPQIAQNIPQIASPNTTNVGQNVCPNIAPQVAQTLYSQNTTQFGQTLNSDLSDKTKCLKQNFGQNVCQIKRVNKLTSPCTSDITSTTCSTRNANMRDKHRTDSCKTYKLIMGKLDELSQLFAARRVPVQTQRVRGSSESVSVCDKVVATDDGRGRNFDAIQVLHSNRMSGRVQTVFNDPLERRQLKVTTEQQERNHSSGDSYSSDPGSVSDVFDLDNPLHLYSQAKGLQGFHASSRRANSNRPPSTRGPKSAADGHYKQTNSMCALCRGYWKIIKQYFKQ